MSMKRLILTMVSLCPLAALWLVPMPVGAASTAAAPPTPLHPYAAVRADDPTRPAAVPLDYVITPTGYFHPSCVQFVEPSEEIDADGSILRADGTRRLLTPCAYPRFTPAGVRIEANRASDALDRTVPPAARATESATDAPLLTTYDGYLAYITALLKTGVNEMTGYLTVPPNPVKQTDQTVYLFPGLERYQDVVSILQPVLGWDASGTSSDHSWTETPWNCCRAGTTYYGPSITVQSGDVIYGSMKLTAKGVWTIAGTDTSNSALPTVTLKTKDSQVFDWVFGSALETYGVNECSQLPAGPINFDVILVYVGGKELTSPPWTVNSGGSAGCKDTSDTIVSPTEQTID